MSSIFSTIFWLCAYLVLVLTPLFVLLIGSVPQGSGFWWDFSMALGFTAMAMMGVQFLLTARFRRATAPFGIDIIYYFHRYLAILAITLIFLHYLIIRIQYVDTLGELNPLQAPWYMTAGRIAFGLFMLLVISSLWRKRFRIHYDEWRLMHIGMAIAAFLLAIGHIEGVGYYINVPVKQAIWTGFILFWLLLVVYVRLIKPWRMRGKPYRVTELRQACCNSWTLTMSPEGHAGFRFKPGQFAWLTLRASPFHIKEHPFSISSSATNSDSVEFTIKELGDFTRTIKQTQVGEVAYLDGPYGVFTVDRYPAAKGFVFIAGGIGAAPIISMLRTLADRKEQRPLLFIYGNKGQDDMMFRQELDTLQTQLPLRVVHVLSNPSPDWKGESGLITLELLQKLLSNEALNYEYFLCGPKPMSNAVQKGLHDLQVPLGHIHFELFDMV